MNIIVILAQLYKRLGVRHKSFTILIYSDNISTRPVTSYGAPIPRVST